MLYHYIGWTLDINNNSLFCIARYRRVYKSDSLGVHGYTEQVWGIYIYTYMGYTLFVNVYIYKLPIKCFTCSMSGISDLYTPLINVLKPINNK